MAETTAPAEKRTKIAFIVVWVLTITLFLWGWSKHLFDYRARAKELREKAQTSPVGTPVIASSRVELQEVDFKDLQTALIETKAPFAIVNLWATWCEPCTRELGLFVEKQKGLAARGVPVFLVSADDKDDPAPVKAFLAEHQVGFPTFIIGNDASAFMAAVQPGWSGGIPATFVLKPDGTVEGFTTGEITAEELDALVESALSTE